MAVADQQVARLDVAVRQPGVPQLADDLQAVVDDTVADFGVAELYRAGKELGHQQVLPVWGEFDKAVGAGGGQPGVPHDAQRVVLLLHQPPHAVERFLVLQLAVQQLPAELVPAVGTQVAAGVELAEQLPGWRIADRDPQRGGAGRAGQPERLDLPGGQAQLLLQGPADGHPPCPADVQMGAAAPPVHDREHLVGGKPAESQ